MPIKREGDWIQTYSGIQFWPFDPRPEEILLEDVAHALSLKCRYNGHCERFYSVAEHSVYVATECLVRWPETPAIALTGLMHDLEEAYMPDIPRPIKLMMGPGVHTMCSERIMKAASKQFGFVWPEPKQVKVVDNAMLATEAEQIMKFPPADWCLPEPALDYTIELLYPNEAEALFKNTYEVLKRIGA